MLEELFRDASAVEIGQIFLLMSGIGFVMQIPITWIVQKILFLKEPPNRRAFRTAAIAYGLAALISIFGFEGFIPFWAAPIVPLLGAVVIYFWLRSDYRRGWIDDDKIPDGVRLENSDWRIGVGVVIAAIVAATIKVLIMRA